MLVASLSRSPSTLELFCLSEIDLHYQSTDYLCFLNLYKRVSENQTTSLNQKEPKDTSMPRELLLTLQVMWSIEYKLWIL